LHSSNFICIFALSNQNNKVMKIRKRLSDFPQKLKIFKAVEKGCSTIEFVGEVNHIDELEDCIIQALLDKNNDYYVVIEHFDKHRIYKNSTKINLIDEDIFDKLDNMFKSATAFPMISFNLINALRHNKEEIEFAKETYEKHYGKIEDA